MTNKFWKDWQKRVGETKSIRIVYNPTISNTCVRRIEPNRFISFEFSGDAVNIVYEEKTYVLSGHYHVENKYVRLHRTEITSIKFK